MKYMGEQDARGEMEFLKALNDSLHDLGKQLTRKDLEEEFTNIFILGLPRSGTTLLSQVLYIGLDLYTTNNLISKFWQSPLVGVWLSKVVIGENKNYSFESEYANTPDIDAPHEFSYFWRNVLKIKDPYNYDPVSADTNINWQKLKETVLNMNHVVGKGFVFKTLEYTGYHLLRFSSLFKEALFVYIERHPLEVAKSIYKARLKFFGDESRWWASVPAEYYELENLSYADQIAGQIFYLQKMYSEKFDTIPDRDQRLITISYKQLCDRPDTILEKIIEKSSEMNTTKLIKSDLKVSPFKISTNKVPKKVEMELKEALKKFDLIH